MYSSRLNIKAYTLKQKTVQMTPEACLQRLPPGLSITEAAKRLKLSWAKTRPLIALHGYQFTDGRQFIDHNRRKIAFYDLDPNFSPSQLAELYGVSRQRVWALAKLYNVQLKGMNRAKRT